MSVITSEATINCCFCSTACNKDSSKRRITVPLWRESAGDQLIPLTRDLSCGKRFHVMTSSLLSPKILAVTFVKLVNCTLHAYTLWTPNIPICYIRLHVNETPCVWFLNTATYHICRAIITMYFHNASNILILGQDLTWHVEHIALWLQVILATSQSTPSIMYDTVDLLWESALNLQVYMAISTRKGKKSTQIMYISQDVYHKSCPVYYKFHNTYRYNILINGTSMQVLR